MSEGQRNDLAQRVLMAPTVFLDSQDIVRQVPPRRAGPKCTDRQRVLIIGVRRG